MLEMIINPKKAEKRPWEMFFIGLIYASISVLVANWFFSNDPVLSKFSGLIIVTFSVMLSLPFMYYLIKQEEADDEKIKEPWGIWKAHNGAIYAFMWLFLGFVVAFSFWYIILGNSMLFDAQVRTYCIINNPGDLEGCVQQYDFTNVKLSTGSLLSKQMKFLMILENNIYVVISTLIFSLIFGAGAIFILAWNASVIAAAVGIFSKYQIKEIPIGVARYMVHGFPEIAAYFITALAGGIIGVGVIKHGIFNKTFLKIMKNSIVLLFIAIIILMAAAAIEVYITPKLF